MTDIEFTVRGRPVAKGSMIARRVGDRTFVVDEKRKSLREWQRAIADEARRSLALRPPFRGAITVSVTFALPRPRSHYRTGSKSDQLRDSAPVWVTTKPDIDKLGRAVLDALTEAAVMVDDSQVVRITAEKVYATDAPSGAVITVREVA